MGFKRKKRGSSRRKFHSRRGLRKVRQKKRKPKKQIYEEPDELKLAPHSFVVHRGSVGRYIMELEKDFRKVMDPFTASSLQVTKKNTLKDFVSVSGPLKVSHLVMFSTSAISPYMRIARMPRGPTLTFRIHNFCIARDVLSSLKKQMTHKKLFAHAPLIILNNFTGEGMHIKLMATTFQNMFPTINVSKVRLSDIRRCVILNYNTTTKCIDFRHYAIRVVPVGISRSVKKIVQSKVPNLSKYEDISDFISKPSMMSESEAEDDPNSYVEVPQTLPSRGNLVSQKSSVRLYELGPRMTLQLIKIEDGLLNGEVMFHEIVKKTEEEKRIIRKRLAQKKKLKEHRRKEQEENVKRKLAEKEVHKQQSLEGMERKRKLEESKDDDIQPSDEENDIDYYREEIGEEPDEDVFHKSGDSTAPKKEFIPRWKKKKMEKLEDKSSTKNNEGSGTLLRRRHSRKMEGDERRTKRKSYGRKFREESDTHNRKPPYGRNRREELDTRSRKLPYGRNRREEPDTRSRKPPYGRNDREESDMRNKRTSNNFRGKIKFKRKNKK